MRKLIEYHFTATAVGILAGVSALLCAPAASAQSHGTDIAEVSPDSLARHRNIGTVIVRGRKNTQATSTAPTFTLGSDAMHRFGFADIGQAVRRLPGVNLKDYGGAGGLKTVSVRGLGAGHTSVSYDGVVLSEMRNGEIDIARYSLDNLGSMQLAVADNDDIFMPARAAASAASLRLAGQTLHLDDSLHLKTQLKGGSFGYFSPSVSVSKGWNETIAIGIAADFMRSDNHYPFKLYNGSTVTTERRNNNRVNTGHGELNLRWAVAPGHNLTSKIYYFDSHRRLPGPVVYYNDANNERLRERNAFWQATLRSRLGSRASLMANAKFNYDMSRYRDFGERLPGGAIDQKYTQREAYASVAFLWLPSTPWAFDYSADYAFNNLNSNLPDDSSPRRHTILQSVAGRWRLSSFSVTARALLSVYLNSAPRGASARNRTRLNPSVSVSYRPLSGHDFFVRASYKNIFRMPTFNESYFFHYGSPDIKPETTDQVNIGITWQSAPAPWLKSLTLTADAYYNNVKDKIVAVPYNMFVWSVTNLGKTRGRGVDISLSADFTPGALQSVILAANYSYQRIEPRSSSATAEFGKQLAYIPLNSGGASVSYENPWLNISLNITATSARYTTNTNIAATRIAGYAELGGALYKPFTIGKCSLEARVEAINILDQQYQVIARYPMPGRSFRASLRVQL